MTLFAFSASLRFMQKSSEIIFQNISGGGVNSPLLSIIVPVYNVEKYLRSCLDSLINQTLKDIEIIIVNDCSPDGSEAIIQEYLQRDDRIVYLKHEQNKCLGGARNTGMRAAGGKYIAFVDSDDYVDLDLYRAALNLFDKYEIDLVSLPFQTFGEDGKHNLFIQYDGIYQADIDQMLRYSYFAAWSKIYRRADIQYYGFVFPEHSYWEDISFWTEICVMMHPRVINIFPQEGGYYYYRQHDKSISQQGSKNYQTLPNVFLYTYQTLLRRGKIAEYYRSFYDLVSQSTVYAWGILQEEYKTAFARSFAEFTRQITFSDEQRQLSPEWCIMQELDSVESKMLLLDIYVEKISLRDQLDSNSWYQFGKLKRKDKLKKMAKMMLKQVFKAVGLLGLCQAVLHKLRSKRQQQTAS